MTADGRQPTAESRQLTADSRQLTADRRKLTAALLVWLSVALGGVMQAVALAQGTDSPEVRVGSKAFSESLVLAEVATLLARDADAAASHAPLGGTRVVWDSLLKGEIDAYPEYTGTIRQELLPELAGADDEVLRARLSELGVTMGAPLGFRNPYALGMSRAGSQRLGVRRISQLAGREDLRFGFSNEFVERQDDGWPALRRVYGLDGEVRGMEHALAYPALQAGDLDVVDVYMTDAAVAQYDIVLLEDDRRFFPAYDAVLLVRTDLARRAPRVFERWRDLAGAIDNTAMLAMNKRVDIDHVEEQRVAADFVAERFGIVPRVDAPRGRWQRLATTTWDHLALVAMSLAAAIAVAIPLGIVAARRRTLGQAILTTAEVVQTIPGLALLVLLGAMFTRVGLPMTGALPAVTALFLYSVLPILRNTMAGLADIPRPLLESADALGLGRWDRLLRIELPLAARTILAGIKTTAVINVGYATLGGLIGAGGYGQPIMAGLRKNEPSLLLEGAIPAALMALAVKGLFEWLERRWVAGE